jgi:hypothetical protein
VVDQLPDNSGWMNSGFCGILKMTEPVTLIEIYNRNPCIRRGYAAIRSALGACLYLYLGLSKQIDL